MWLLEHAVGFCRGWGPPTLDEGHHWRYAALLDGHAAVDVLVADHLGLPSPDPAGLRPSAGELRLLALELRTPVTDHRFSLLFVKAVRRRLAARLRAAGSAEERRAIRKDLAWLSVDAMVFRAAARTGPRRRRPSRGKAAAGRAPGPAAAAGATPAAAQAAPGPASTAVAGG